MPRVDGRHRRVALVALAAMVLAGCARGGGTGAGAEQAAPEQPAIEVQGVASCDTLPQTALSGEATGDRLPPMQLSCLTPGPSIDLSALRGGTPVLVNLWASWCGPCREEMPILQAAHEQYGEQVQFLGVDSKDTAEAGASFLGDIGVTYPQVVDPEGELLNHLGVPGLPVTVLLDDEGRIAATHVGQLDTESIEELLANVLP